MTYEQIERRDELAFRQAFKSDLTAAEEIELVELDALIDAEAEPSEGLSDEVMEIIRSVLGR